MPLPAFPIATPQTPRGREAAELHERAAAAVALVEGLDAERAAAHNEKASLETQLKAELTAVYADGKATSRQATDLANRLAAAETKIAEPWHVRLAAARVAAPRLEGQYRRFMDTNFEALHEEFAEAGQEARDRLLAAVDGSSLDELHAAYADYQAIAERVRGLADYARHIDRSDVAGVRPPFRRGSGRTFHNAPRRIESPESALAAVRACRAGDGDLDAALPLPLVTPDALDWRRDQLTGATKPSTLTNL